MLGGPPARAVDVRVADSPLVGIRFHLDSRMGDLMEALEQADRERAQTLERRSGVLNHLRRNELARAELLRSLPRQARLAVRRWLIEGPLQRLSEAVFDAEVAFRQAAAEPGAAQEKATLCRVATIDARDDFMRLIRHWRPLHGGATLIEAIQELLADRPPETSAHILLFGAERRLPAAVELAAYRIVEDALDNALRHGRAGHVEVILAYHPERLSVVVKDDGDGFDVVATEALLGRSRGIGMLSMHTRATIVGGRLDVRSVIGGGAEVRAAL